MTEQQQHRSFLDRYNAVPVRTRIIAGVAALSVAGALTGGVIVAGAGNGSGMPQGAASASASAATVKPNVQPSRSTPPPEAQVPSASPSASAEAAAPAEEPGSDADTTAQEQAAAASPADPGYVPPAAPAAVPAPAAPAPAPAPAPAAPPAPANPFIDSSGYNRTYAQNLGTINSARASLGAPGFVAVTAACSVKGTAYGSSLDGGQGGVIQHQGIVGGVFGNTTGATYAPDPAAPLSAGTLTVYRCS